MSVSIDGDIARGERTEIHVRASSLPNYGDCARSASLHWFADEIEAAGYQLRKGNNSAAIAIGQNLHYGSSELLRQIKVFGYLGREEIHRAVQNTMNKLDEDFAKNKNYIWDATTKDEMDARMQLKRMLESLVPVLQTLQPTHIEHPLEAHFSPLGKSAIPIFATGIIDVRDAQAYVPDHKTGAKAPAAHAQLGLYSLLCKENGLSCNRVAVNFCQRVGAKKEQPPVQVIPYTLEECEQMAWSYLRKIQQDYEMWREASSPHSFSCNPRSMICTPKYCRAFGTGWCIAGKEAHPNAED